MDFLQVINFINNTGLTSQQLGEITQAVKYARAQLSNRQIRSCVKGDSVRFTNPKNGATFSGTVEQVKIKNVVVATAQGRYNVPANLLEFV
jgi:hypothetical protein